VEEDSLLTEIGGVFVKIVFVSDIDVVLARGLRHRPAARFNRPGQDALYLSPGETSARVAIRENVKSGAAPRVLLTFAVERCTLFDLRHQDASPVYALARPNWRGTFESGNEPTSWAAADIIRRAGHVGLIDPSRRRPGLWHITLMRWNEPDAPSVQRVGSPIPIAVAPDPE
jgi:RES domain-containing protein